MEFDIFLGVAALVIAAVLTWCILRFFFAPRRGGARATLHDGVQQAVVTPPISSRCKPAFRSR